MRNKKSDNIHQILVIMARKIVFCKKVIKMIMKIDVSKTGFKAKKGQLCDLRYTYQNMPSTHAFMNNCYG